MAKGKKVVGLLNCIFCWGVKQFGRYRYQLQVHNRQTASETEELLRSPWTRQNRAFGLYKSAEQKKCDLDGFQRDQPTHLRGFLSGGGAIMVWGGTTEQRELQGSSDKCPNVAESVFLMEAPVFLVSPGSYKPTPLQETRRTTTLLWAVLDVHDFCFWGPVIFDPKGIHLLTKFLVDINERHLWRNLKASATTPIDVFYAHQT